MSAVTGEQFLMFSFKFWNKFYLIFIYFGVALSICGLQILVEATEEETAHHDRIELTYVKPPNQLLPPPVISPEQDMVSISLLITI